MCATRTWVLRTGLKTRGLTSDFATKMTYDWSQISRGNRSQIKIGRKSKLVANQNWSQHEIRLKSKMVATWNPSQNKNGRNIKSVSKQKWSQHEIRLIKKSGRNVLNFSDWIGPKTPVQQEPDFETKVTYDWSQNRGLEEKQKSLESVKLSLFPPKTLDLRPKLPNIGPKLTSFFRAAFATDFQDECI